MGNRLSICKRKSYKSASDPSQGKENKKAKNKTKNKKHHSRRLFKMGKSKEDKKNVHTKSKDEMSWEKVIEIFEMENPDTIAVLEAWDTAQKLARDTFKEKEELIKQSKKLWSTQTQARDTQNKLIMRLKEAKYEWKKLKAKSDEHSGEDSDEEYQEATDEAWENYKKTKKDMKIAEKIADETLDFYLRLQKTIPEKEMKYNQRVRKINTAIARLKECEQKALFAAKKRISHEGKYLKEATQRHDNIIDMMKKTAKAAEDAKEKFMEMEDIVACAREEHDKEVFNVCCEKKKLKELNKLKLKGLMEWENITESGLDTDSEEWETDSEEKETDSTDADEESYNCPYHA